MYVRVTRALGFMVGNVLHTVRPNPHPQFLPDEAMESDGFMLAVGDGTLSFVQPQIAEEKAVESAPQKKDKKEK